MTNYFSDSLNHLIELFSSHSHKQSALKGEENISHLVEHVVDVVDPKIRVIGRYAQKLSTPVARTWEYLNDVVNVIPGGVALDRTAFSRDARMKLIFGSQGVIQGLLDSAKTIIDSKHQKQTVMPSHIYMLLCMEKSEHSFLGAELVGDIIKRDVMQTKVSFSNRKILSAGYNEEDARMGFKNCAFEGLLNKAHGLLSESHKQYRQLIERKRQLHQQLHTNQDTKYMRHSTIFTRNDYLFGASPELLEIERQLGEIRMKTESPDFHLAMAVEVLNHPEQYLKVDIKSMTLNNHGIRLSAGNASGIHIDYAEVEIESSLKRIAMVVSCAAEEVNLLTTH